MHKMSAANIARAIRHHISLGRDHHGYYFIMENGQVWNWSYGTTHQSGNALINKYLFFRRNEAQAQAA